MLRTLVLFAGLFITKAQTTFCNNISEVSTTTSGECPSGQITPDCGYIQATVYSICQNTELPLETGVNGGNCAVATVSYGCAFITKTIPSDFTFCCQPYSFSATPTPTPSASPSASTSFIMETPTPSITSSPSETPSQTPTPSITPSSSISSSVTPSTTSTATHSPSTTSTATHSPSTTSTATSTPSPTSSPSVSANWASPPPLPPLTNISFTQVKQFINQIANYQPDVIQGVLLEIASAALSNGKFAISTSSFNMTLQSLPPNISQTLSQGDLQVIIPPLPGVDGAASLIQWKTNPYQASSNVIPDSSVVSISVINPNGTKVSVKGLKNPISFNLPLTIKKNDPRFLPPPLYLLMCSDNEIMIHQGRGFIPFNGANLTKNGTWVVPCLLDSWQRVECTSTIQQYQCPAPVITYECLYWNTNKSMWSGDGCTATSGSQSSISCACTHLTDFSSRINAVVTSNIKVFENANNVYSETGLVKYAQWYGLFGSLGAGCILLCLVVLYIDIRSRRRYIHSLFRNEEVLKIMKDMPRMPISSYDEDGTLQNMKTTKKLDEAPLKLNILHRILQQHPFFHFIFRYDPRLSRVLRLLFICVVQFHSLFITAFLYGFTYGNKGGMAWHDTAILAAITTALNLPVVNLLVWAFNRIGTIEFQAQFPILYYEYLRRSAFEQMALVYLHKIGDKPNVGSLVFKAPPVIVTEKYLKDNDALNELNAKDILRKMAGEIENRYESKPVYSSFWNIFPAHSWQANLSLTGLLGWLAWCLNFLLLFASANEVHVGQEVMTSWAASEITNIFVIQPLTIGLTVLFYIGMNRYDKYIPSCIKKNKTIRSIPSLFYFSNPWNELSHSTLTSEFAYIIFVKCGAFASHAEELAYAPLNAIANEVGDEKTKTEEARVKELYEAMKKAYQELNE